MIRVGVREFTKNFSRYQNIDMVEIIDKKTDEIKGVFISSEAAEKVKDLLSKGKKEKIEGILKFAGIAHGEFGDMNVQDIKRKKREKYYE
jgi:hypothetical protein